MARFAITSFMFMLREVPAPPWKASTGNWSANCPAAISSQAWQIASAFSGESNSSLRLVRAAAFFTRASARISSGCEGRPETGKFSTARRVWMPQ